MIYLILLFYIVPQNEFAGRYKDNTNKRINKLFLKKKMITYSAFGPNDITSEHVDYQPKICLVDQYPNINYGLRVI